MAMPAIGLAILALMGFGSAAIFARVGMQTVGAPTVTIISLCFSFLASGILALIFALGDFGALPLIVLAWCLMLGAFNFLGGRNLSFQAIGRIGAARAGAIVGTSAVFASILAITLTGERPHWIVLAGTVVVVAGLTTALGKNLLESGRGGAAGEGWVRRRTGWQDEREDDSRFTPAKSVNRDVGDVGQDGRMDERKTGGRGHCSTLGSSGCRMRGSRPFSTP